MAFTGQQIVDRALLKANDVSAASWGATESLYWVNDAQRAIVQKLHKAGATQAQPTVVAGSRQTTAGLSLTNAIAIIDVVCNVSGSTRGAPIRRTSRAWLDDELPGWHAAEGDTIDYWVQDERDPLAFYIYPQIATGTPKIEVIYAATPADLASLASSFSLADIYADAAQYFVLFSYFSKDITKLKSAQYAAQYYQLFMQALGIQDDSLSRTAAMGNAKEQGA